MARVIFVARRHARIENMLSLRVDEVFVHMPSAVRPRFIAEIEAITYDVVHTILPPGRKAKYQKANSSTAPVYRVKLVEEAAFPEERRPCEKKRKGCYGIVTPHSGPPTNSPLKGQTAGSR